MGAFHAQLQALGISLRGAGSNTLLQPPVPFPATLAANGAGATYSSGVFMVPGPGLTVTANLSEAGTVNIQRYGDFAKTAPVGSAITQKLTATDAAWVAVNDGLPYLFAEATIVNTSGVAATLSETSITCSGTGV